MRRAPRAGVALSACCLLLGLGRGFEASAQTYPARTIRLIVAFAPGGSLDRAARIVAPKLGDALGQQIVIDNRPGAGGNLAAELAAKSAPDGYTLFITGIGFVVNVSLYKTLNYDPLKDFAPITQLGSTHNVLVSHPSLPVRSVRELIALAKKMPGKIDFVSSGSGTSGHLTMELFKSLAGISLMHIPYKSIAQAQADLVAGQVPLFFPTIPGALPFIRSGRVIALGVSGSKRSPVLAQIPTMVEAGVPGYEVMQWYGVLAPARVPAPIIELLSREIARGLHQPDVKPRLAADGSDAVGNTPAEFGAHIRSEVAKWAKLTKQLGLKAD